MEYYKPQHKNIFNAESGLVFLGTPHATYELESKLNWSRLSLLVRSSLREGKKHKEQIKLAEEQTPTVAGICAKFSEVVINTSILTVFEKKATTVKTGKWWSKEHQVVSNRAKSWPRDFKY
jgi:hypothetical protein